MAEVIVKTNFNSGWNIGDTVELSGKELKEALANDDVVLVNQPEEIKEEVVPEVKETEEIVEPKKKDETQEGGDEDVSKN